MVLSFQCERSICPVVKTKCPGQTKVGLNIVEGSG
jgi:hypothetical protein